MATNDITHGKCKQKHSEEEQQQEEEEEEEALSLCDLPDNSIDQGDQPRKSYSHIAETEELEEFDFQSFGGPFSIEPEMCAADEVFFQGQILPLRLSSKTTLSQRYSQQFNQCEWRSESLDHSSLSEFRSNSSRSSSIRSQNSYSSSTSSTTTTTKTTTRISNSRVHNQSHKHPSPKPKLRVTVPRQGSFGNQGRRSSSWEFFRLGVVPAPEIGLRDIKVRRTNNANKNSVSRNSSSNSSSGGNSFNANSSGKSKNILKQLVGKGGGGGLFGDCKCSIDAVQSDIVIIRSDSKSSSKTESTTHAMKENVLELKKQKQTMKQEKKGVSRFRSFEWIKELWHANYPDK